MITTPPHFLPEISVVIPMYNVEKYIGACLESLLAQTFQNFEVIVVDDCSTDNSAAVVESYAPKFGGRLSLFKSQVNSGPAVPSNRGVALSRGKYIYCMDSDDLIVANALLEMYQLAENLGADVISMDLGFKFFQNTDKPFPAQEDIQVTGWHAPPFVDKNLIESDDISERVKKICRNGVGWTAWEKLVRRDLLMENGITFPEMRTSQDIIWVMEVFSCAKKIVTIPNLLYIHRNNLTSNTSIKRTPAEHIQFYMNANVRGIKFLGEFLNRQRFFQDNPQYKWALFNFYELVHFNTILSNIAEMSPQDFCSDVEFGLKKYFNADSELIAYFCTSSNLSRLQLINATQRVTELEQRLKNFTGG